MQNVEIKEHEKNSNYYLSKLISLVLVYFRINGKNNPFQECRRKMEKNVLNRITKSNHQKITTTGKPVKKSSI